MLKYLKHFKLRKKKKWFAAMPIRKAFTFGVLATCTMWILWRRRFSSATRRFASQAIA